MDKIMRQMSWLAICIYHEARGESLAGQIAVGHVIMNRVKKEGKSVEDVVLRPYQFSWANGGNRPAIGDYAAFLTCMESALACLSERMDGKDFFGADHYFADYIKSPAWAASMTFVRKAGKHLFYRS